MISFVSRPFSSAFISLFYVLVTFDMHILPYKEYGSIRKTKIAVIPVNFY